MVQYTPNWYGMAWILYRRYGIQYPDFSSISTRRRFASSGVSASLWDEYACCSEPPGWRSRESCVTVEFYKYDFHASADELLMGGLRNV